jgi:hypothetical protein
VIDANGGSARVATIFNTFTVSDATGLPIIGGGPPVPFSDPTSQSVITKGADRKCPGGNERSLGEADPSDDSVPFTDAGALTDGKLGDCDPTIQQPGP